MRLQQFSIASTSCSALAMCYSNTTRVPGCEPPHHNRKSDVHRHNQPCALAQRLTARGTLHFEVPTA